MSDTTNLERTMNHDADNAAVVAMFLLVLIPVAIIITVLLVVL